MDAAQTATADDLTELIGALRDGERCIARAVLLAGRVAGSGVCEAVEGLPLEHFLGLACRLTGADRRTLVAAGEALADLPCVAALFSSGALSWGQVRAVVRQVRRLPRAERAVLDARVAETARRDGGVDAFDPDQLVGRSGVQWRSCGRRAAWSGRRGGGWRGRSWRCRPGSTAGCGCTPTSIRCWRDGVGRVGRGCRAAPPRAARTDRAGRPRAAGAGCRATRATRAARGPGRAGRGGARAGGVVGDDTGPAVRPGAGEGLLGVVGRRVGAPGEAAGGRPRRPRPGGGEPVGDGGAGGAGSAVADRRRRPRRARRRR